LLVVLLAVLIGVGFFLANPGQADRLMVELGLAEPEARQYVLAGFLEADVRSVSSPIGGRVNAVQVVEGEHVEAGQPLVSLDARQLGAQLRLAQAELRLIQAKASMVRAGAREEALAVLRARLELARAGLKVAGQALEAAEELEPESAREAALTEAHSQVAAAEAQEHAAVQALEAAEEGATQAERRAAEAAVAAAQANVQSLAGLISDQELKAPIEGTVLQVIHRAGELVSPGQPAVRLANLERMRLTIYVPEADLDLVEVGAQVAVRVDAYPDRRFEGKVTGVAVRAEFTPRNVQTPQERVILVYAVDVEVQNGEGLLKPGLPADAIFEVNP
jgi:HlyD family secretion protein